ncbi:hypothetical protein L596_000770 [Steinernema carpocapsae]|uniref:Uncharacterized protein n=1 Tax=Steinernema carpocapsae TaxID=34508 RepID=A0A4U8UJR4_STECR|nr:hypothetical protein L596_000770 [Steinernema carpocapsae]
MTFVFISTDVRRVKKSVPYRYGWIEEGGNRHVVASFTYRHAERRMQIESTFGVDSSVIFPSKQCSTISIWIPRKLQPNVGSFPSPWKKTSSRCPISNSFGPIRLAGTPERD